MNIGIVGAAGRGSSFKTACEACGDVKIHAVCDLNGEKLTEAKENLGAVEHYTDYYEMLEKSDLQAVVIGSPMQFHAEQTIAALERDINVLCEVTAGISIEECKAVVAAAKVSKAIYMLAENYPYMVYNQEMHKLYREGVVGDFTYGECEYVHPDSAETKLKRSCGINHWRNWIPATYYCTHSIAPVMFITDTRPVKVNGFTRSYDFNDPTQTMTCRKFDMYGLIILRMDNDAVVKSLHGGLRGHQNYTRIHGNKGLMENCRHGDKYMVRIKREQFEKNQGEPTEKIYLPDFPEFHEEAIKTGHGGGDFFTNYHFGEAIRRNEQPWLNVYRAIDMTICGIQAYKSVLNDSAPMSIPDFRDEEVRKQHENDHWTPDPVRKGPGQPPVGLISNEIKIPKETMDYCKKVWAEEGYTEE